MSTFIESVKNMMNWQDTHDAVYIRACTNRTFRNAAASNLVWNAKLPWLHTEVLKGAEETLSNALLCSRKSVYDCLSQRVLLTGGHETIGIDRAIGLLQRRQGARAMTVAWGEDERYWQWVSEDTLRMFEGQDGLLSTRSFAEVAVLRHVCWLESWGRMKCALPAGHYAFLWRLAFKSRSVYGWVGTKVIFTFETDDGQQARSKRCLEPKERKGEWQEVEVGRFEVRGARGRGRGRVGRAEVWLPGDFLRALEGRAGGGLCGGSAASVRRFWLFLRFGWTSSSSN